jgi:hypothetical protein
MRTRHAALLQVHCSALLPVFRVDVAVGKIRSIGYPHTRCKDEIEHDQLPAELAKEDDMPK